MNTEKFIKEIEIQKFWEENKIYEKVQKRNKDGKPFNFVEGPPYPTGECHLGHLRNWAIKDSVLRFKRFQGCEVYARDGYDAHGLPVENKVQKKFNITTVDKLKDFGVDNFIKECRDYAYSIINEMTGLRGRYGFWLDKNPYLTFHPEYISLAWRFFKIAHEKNLLYKDYKTVGWCPHDETTLSDYELKDEYKVLSDPSIYVKFPLRKDECTTNYNEFFVIWTTTPWTLQSNMAIAMNPQINYAKVLIELNGKKEVLIVAEKLVETVIKKLSKSNDIKFKSVLEVKVGIEFEGIKYDHIYLDETPSQQDFLKLDHKYIHSIVMADYVTLGEGEDIFDKLDKRGYKHSNVDIDKKEKIAENKSVAEGTGLVHIAPGHGFDDYDVGKIYNLPIFCPVDKSGNFNEGKYEGMYFKDVDSVAIKYLTKKGFMLFNEQKEHRYPCCWRCKTPIVYRATDQWWIKRASQTDGVIKENSNVHWFPKSAKTNFNNLREGAGDWAISRQRFWGIPIPIWEDEEGNYEVIGSKEEIEKLSNKKLADLHLDNLRDIIIVKDGKKMKHVGLTTDVWYESGCASFASHYDEGLNFEQIIDKYYPMTWITEGEDQIRGWFSSLFNVGYTITGKAPYNQVLFYRYVMDKNGVKMSKSLGNGISGNQSIENWGADATRYYLLTKIIPQEQLNFNSEEFSLVDGFFNTLENIFKYSNDYLKWYEIRHPTLTLSGLDITDKWILYKLNKTIEKFTHNMENFKLNYAFKEVENLIVNDFSKIYLKLIKERTEEFDENLIIVLNEVLKKSLIMLSMAIPFKCESLYQESSLLNKKESIFLESMPEIDLVLIKKIESEEIDKNFDLAQDVISGILNSREKVKIGVRWPLSEVNIISSFDLKNKLNLFEPLIKKLTNILKLNYNYGDDVKINYIIKPNFVSLKQDFKDLGNVIKTINLNKHYINEDLKKGNSSGKYEKIELDYEKHIIKEIELNGDFVSSDFNCGNVILHTYQDELLLEEGYLRELLRRVQSLRKDLGLNKNDKINLSFDGSDKYFDNIISNCENLIKKKVGAEDILQNKLSNEKEFKIKDKKLVVSIEKNKSI